MVYLIICIVAVLVSGVTLFSGFGLGTVLMPAFALFFPVPVAIAATAIVHLANNLFKLALVGRSANWRIALKFSLPAAIAAVAGASLLNVFAALPMIASYDLAGRTHEITVIGAVIGSLIVTFALLELSPRFAELTFSPRYLVLGGVLSGFLGAPRGLPDQVWNDERGLHRHQRRIGGYRRHRPLSDLWAFLLPAKLCAPPHSMVGIVAAATAAAFAGAYFGARLIGKVTLRAIQLTVAVAMMIVGFGLATGLI